MSDDPKYHIRIESSEHGVIFEAETDKFGLIFNKGDGGFMPQTRWRGITLYEMAGLLMWELDQVKLDMRKGSADADPLIDQERDA